MLCHLIFLLGYENHFNSAQVLHLPQPSIVTSEGHFLSVCFYDVRIKFLTSYRLLVSLVDFSLTQRLVQTILDVLQVNLKKKHL